LTGTGKTVSYLVRTREGDALFGPWLSDPKTWATSAMMLRVAVHGLAGLWRQDTDRIKAGEQLEECPYALVGTPVMMLAGMALETLAKGAIAGQCGAEWKGVLPRELRTHNVAELLERAGIVLSADERELVERLEVLIEWFGRYPVPTNPQKGMRFGVPARIEDLDVFSGLYTRVAALLTPHETVRNGEQP
jgi:hypothetical protein